MSEPKQVDDNDRTKVDIIVGPPVLVKIRAYQQGLRYKEGDVLTLMEVSEDLDALLREAGV